MMDKIEENKTILIVLALLVGGFFWFGGLQSSPTPEVNGTSDYSEKSQDSEFHTATYGYSGGGGGGVTSTSDDAYQDDGEWFEEDGTPVTNGTAPEDNETTPITFNVISPLNKTQFYEDDDNTFVLFEIDTDALNCVIADSKYDTPLELDENNQHLLEIHNGWCGRHNWNVVCDEGESELYWFKINPHRPRGE